MRNFKTFLREWLLEESKDGKLPANHPDIKYQGPEDAPFRCDRCEYFYKTDEPCEKVSTPIKAGGCCKKFENK